MNFYLDTIEPEVPNAGKHMKVFRCSHAFYKIGNDTGQLLGPVFGYGEDIFVCCMDLGRWLEEHGKDVSLQFVHSREHRGGYGSFYLYFGDNDAALLYKLTWGGM